MKVLVVGGSSRPENNTLKVAKASFAFLQKRGVEVELLDLAGSDVPLIGQEIKLLESFTEFENKVIEKFTNAQLIFICAPEYNWGMSGFMKNFLDQFGVKKLVQMWDKKVFALAGVSDGTGGKISAAEISISLSKIISFAGATSVLSPKIFLSQVTQDKVESDGTIKDVEYGAALERFIDYAINLSNIFQKGIESPSAV